MRNQLLLVEDVEDLGRSGDIVSVKPGYCRNFLLPKKKAVIADKFTLRMQAKLKEERAKRAEIDHQEAQVQAKRLEGMILSTEVKVDPDGHMYGSVAAIDIVRLLEAEGIHLERRNVVLAHPIKTLGVHPIHLKLKEGVPVQITLKVIGEGNIPLLEEPTAGPAQG
jgi:large subunit ribosomal protein L9